MNKLNYLIIMVVAMACQPTTSNQPVEQNTSRYQKPAHHSESLTKVFDAHGGYEQWSRMKSLSYKRGEESTIVNLQNRMIRLESATQTIGYDGKDVWVTPDSVDVSRARFYHNLYFYFYAMPFVVGDPGTYYEEVGPRELNGKTYHGIKVSYGEGVGDAPDDNYILWVDPATNQMEWLMYTVTYRSGEPSDKYSLIRYDGWTSFNGVVLPTTLQWFTYDGNDVGDPRGEATIFSEVILSEEAPDASQFMRPEGAVIAPLNNATGSK